MNFRRAIGWATVLLVHAGFAQAQEPTSAADSPLKITCLYDADSRQPGVLIPFQVTGEALLKGGTIQVVKISGAGLADCRVMLDPYRKVVYLLKCDREAEVQLNFDLLLGDKTILVNYGPITIKKPSVNLEPIEPAQSVANYIRGKQLYSVYCLGCHTPPSAKRGKTAEAIKLSVKKEEKMRELIGVLKDPDFKAIETYLKSP